MMREPIVTAVTRYVRVVANILTEEYFSPLLFDCTNSRKQENRGFAQSTFFNVESHDVGGVL